MMNQESYVDIKSLREQGWTLEEIAAETGWHPATISRRLKQGPPPARRPVPDEAKVMDAFWSERVRGLIGDHPRLLGVSVFRCLAAEGFSGGYSTVTRELRRIRGPRFRAADRVSVPIHTDPGEEALGFPRNLGGMLFEEGELCQRQEEGSIRSSARVR